MQVEFMRKIDYWLGVPICFFISVFSYFTRLGVVEKDCPKPKNILFLELSEMGSTVLSYPTIKRAKEEFSDSQIYFFIFKKNKESVEVLNIFPKNHIWTLNSDSLFTLLWDVVLFMINSKKAKIDTVFDLELFSRFTAILSFLSGAKTRVGFFQYNGEGLYRGNLLTHRVSYNPYFHMSENFLAQLESLKEKNLNEPLVKKKISTGSLCPPQTVVEEQVLINLEKRFKKLYPAWKPVSNKIILLNTHPGNLLPIRGWPLGNFINLAKEILCAYPDYLVVLIGLSEADSHGEKIQKEIRSNRLINFIGQTKNLKELIGVFTLSRVLITNDSGPAHFAVLTNIKSIVLFGPEIPVLYSSLGSNSIDLYLSYSCSPCVSAYNHRKTICTDNKCLKDISVKMVRGALDKLLNINNNEL